MDLSSQQSQDEARISERKLYRAGQTPAAPKSPAVTPARSPAKPAMPALKSPLKSQVKATSGKPSTGKRILLVLLTLGVGYYLLFGTQTQRKRVLIGLGVMAWMLMLGGISYCLSLPDLEQIAKEQRAVWSDPNLTFDEKREKFKEINSKLTDGERRQMREIGMKERERKGNADMYKFLQLSPKEQVEQLKSQDAARKQKFQQWASKNRPSGGQGGGRGAGGGGAGGGGGVAMGGGAGGGGGKGAGGGGAGGAGMNRGGGGAGGGGAGGGGGGWGRGGGGDRNVKSRSRLDNSSPESRAGRSYQRGLNNQLGLGGGFGGPRGGGPKGR
jgi:hypothetical protein